MSEQVLEDFADCSKENIVVRVLKSVHGALWQYIHHTAGIDYILY